MLETITGKFPMPLSVNDDKMLCFFVSFLLSPPQNKMLNNA